MKGTNALESVKSAAYAYCTLYVEQRLKRIHIQIGELEAAMNSETKSSAGDKHETGRAMIQLEREQLGQQLSELEKTQQLLSKVPINRDARTVGLGSLVMTDSYCYYIAISAGRFNHEGTAVYCISAATPIGQSIMGKTVGFCFHFNGNNTLIRSIH